MGLRSGKVGNRGTYWARIGGWCGLGKWGFPGVCFTAWICEKIRTKFLQVRAGKIYGKNFLNFFLEPENFLEIFLCEKIFLEIGEGLTKYRSLSPSRSRKFPGGRQGFP